MVSNPARALDEKRGQPRSSTGSGVDIARPDIARKKRRQRVFIVVAGVAALTVVSVALSHLQPAAPTVDKASIWMDTVKRGSMLREVRGNGILVPEEIRWVTATSGGRIERIPLLPGVTVTADTVLLELSNPELKQAAFDADSALQSASAQLDKLVIQLKSDRLAQESVIANLKSELTLAQIEAEADEKLRQDGLVPELIAKRSRAKAEELKARHELEGKRLLIADESASVQLSAQTNDLVNLRRQLELKQQQVEALKVRAGVNGVLQRLGDEQPLRIGQQLSTGATVARVADPSRLKAEIKIAETQAKDVQHGQPALIDTRNGMISGHVVRIDPAVQNGTVTVDVTLDAALPRGARPDLSVDGTITLERLEDVLYVGRPVNGQPESKISLFKVTNGGREAIRVPVQMGRSSVSTVEIREGLQIGDQLILSDMSQWDAHDRIKLN
jgi:HlyD family secretion protein